MTTAVAARPAQPRSGSRVTRLLPGRARTSPVPEVLCRGARWAVLGLLDRMSQGWLDVEEAGMVSRFGPDHQAIGATVRIVDPRAWWAIATEGSIGLGRGYIEGWWESDDPVAVVRVIGANLEPLQGWQRRKATTSRLLASPRRRRRSRDQRVRDREDIAAHYDIGTDFFSLFLDESLSYSSAVFASDDTSLQEASIHKYDRLLDKLGVGPGDHVLEIGSGWGGFALRAASTRGCQVTTTTISADQHSEAERRIRAAGLGRSIELLDVDWRSLTGRFDKIVSVEMIEAVSWRHYDQYFAAIERCLVPDGAAALQAICVPGRRFDRARQTEDFIKRFVFPGGGLPSLDAMLASLSRSTGMQLTDVEDLSAHYAETVARWRRQLDQNHSRVIELGFDERFCRLWRFYLSYSEAAFVERLCTVNQLVLVGRDWRPDGLALRPH